MIAASSAAIPLATKAATMNCARSAWATRILFLLTQLPSAGRLDGVGISTRRNDRRKIIFQPIVYDAPDAGVVFRKHEMVEAAEQMQLGRLTGALEHFDRLFGRGHGVVGAVQE